MSDEGLKSLAQSIKEHGILQPLIVRRSKEGYEIAAGERRLKAAKLAGLTEVPPMTDLSDAESLEAALAENLQREDLSSIEVARSLAEMIDRFSMTHGQIASRPGWSRPAVSNKLRLLICPMKYKSCWKKKSYLKDMRESFGIGLEGGTNCTCTKVPPIPGLCAGSKGR